MVQALLADINTIGQVEYLDERMQAAPWSEFWLDLNLVLVHFDEVGLVATSSDLEIWTRCQEDGLLLITNNRTNKDPDSLESAIRQLNMPESLPVFTIADLDKLRHQSTYADRIIESLFEYLYRLDSIRGAGRLYLP